ncbi:hypothetical protein [Glaesserella sp.]|uniref:hypothetical protein n=1 Tax=Glaesserella sp. TaxID=2094731 RepID=UPI00359FE0B7
MKNRITHFYTEPFNQPYKLLTHLNHHFWSIIIVLVGGILVYPVFKYGYNHQQHRLYQQQSQQLTQELTQQTHLLTSVQNYQTESNKKDSKFASINQQIKDVLDQNHANIENIQWGFEREKTVYLNINQQTESIFQIIEQLNQLETVRFKEIHLFKLGYQRLIQLNSTLSVIP